MSVTKNLKTFCLSELSNCQSSTQCREHNDKQGLTELYNEVWQYQIFFMQGEDIISFDKMDKAMGGGVSKGERYY